MGKSSICIFYIIRYIVKTNHLKLMRFGTLKLFLGPIDRIIFKIRGRGRQIQHNC